MPVSKRQLQAQQVIKDKVEGVWIPEHTADGHFYRTKDGPLQPSVTTKLSILNKPHLLRWSIKQGIEWLEKEERWKYLSIPKMRNNYIKGAQEAYTEIRDDAGSVGTAAHDAIEKYIKHWIATGEQPRDVKQFFPYVDGRIMADPRSIASARGLEKLFKEKRVYPIASEILVGDPKVSAGTLDFLCIYDRCLELWDFKTSNRIDQTNYTLQVALYKKFFEQMTGLKIRRCRIIHVSKDYDKFDVYIVKRPAEAYRIGKKVCQIYDWMYDGREKIIKDIKKKVIK